MRMNKRKLLFLSLSSLLLIWLVYLNNYSYVSNRITRNSHLLRNNSNPDGIFITENISETVREPGMVELDNVRVKSEDCKNMTFPNQMPSDGLWMSVVASPLAFVYSAFQVNSTENKIVIVGALARPTNTNGYFCQFWRRNSRNSKDIHMRFVLAIPKTLPESHGKRYSAAFFHCKMELDYVPNYVSIATGNCKVPNNLLMVQQATLPSKYIRNFTVCLSPMTLQYSRVFELVEWLELNRILGADKFLVYNHSIARNVSHVLEYYAKRDVVEILYWNLPTSVSHVRNDKTTLDIHYFGQLVALNDCLYRNKKFSKFVVNVDLDEFIIPHSVKMQTWHDLVSDNKIAYIFRNTFFKKEWSLNTNRTKLSNLTTVYRYPPFVTLQKLQHERKVFMPKDRSKYFARTSDVSKLMIHEIPGVKAEHVPIGIAMLHHYRHWGGDNRESEDNRVYDDTIPVRYGEQLVDSVEQTWSKLNKTNMMVEHRGDPGN